MKTSGRAFSSVIILGMAWTLALSAEQPLGPDWVPRLLTEEEAREGFYPLFNGWDLDGWTIRAKNKNGFAVKDGMLVVRGSVPHDWIFTVREHENFVLRYEYRLPEEGGNSGVGIRAPAEGDPAFTGMEIQVLTPSQPHKGSAGALYSSVAPARKADHPVGQWNAVEVLCDGPRIRTTMNGTELYDIRTTDFVSREDNYPPLSQRAKSGFIAIQDHEDYVEYRNIRLKPLPAGEGWRRLFNGENLDGWQTVGDASWTVMDGGILRVDGGTMTKGTRSALRTLEEFDDFELRLSIRAHDGANSGVFFRCSGDDPWPSTYEVQVDNHSPEQFTGAIWDQVKARELRATDNCWFQMHVVADGPIIQVMVNGKTVVDYISQRHAKYKSGWIALQGHDPESIVDFKDIEIKPIKTGLEGP